MKIIVCCAQDELSEKIKKSVYEYFYWNQKINLRVLSKEELREKLKQKICDFDLLLMHFEPVGAEDTIRLLLEYRSAFPILNLIGIGGEWEDTNYYPALFEVDLLYYIYEDKMDTYLPRALKMASENVKKIDDNSLICRSNSHYIKIPFNDITVIERELHTTKVYTEDSCYMIRRKLNELDEVLENYPALIRCHMSFFVNWNYVVLFENKKFHMKNGEIIPVSRKYYKEVKEYVEEKFYRN